MPLWAEAQLGGPFTPCGPGWAALFRRVSVTVMATCWAVAAGGGSQLKLVLVLYVGEASYTTVAGFLEKCSKPQK